MNAKAGMTELNLGPTGRTVAENLRRLREARNLSYAALSAVVGESNRKIPPLALRRIEAYARRVDVDDLVALAVALEVSPVDFLFTRETDDRPVGTGLANDVSADDALAWGTMKTGLTLHERLGYWTRVYYDAGMRSDSLLHALESSGTEDWERDRAQEDLSTAHARLRLAWDRLSELQTTFGTGPLPTIGGMPDIRGVILAEGEIPPPAIALGRRDG